MFNRTKISKDVFFLNLVTLFFFFLTLSQVAGARHLYSICAIIILFGNCLNSMFSLCLV